MIQLHDTMKAIVSRDRNSPKISTFPFCNSSASSLLKKNPMDLTTADNISSKIKFIFLTIWEKKGLTSALVLISSYYSVFTKATSHRAFKSNSLKYKTVQVCFVIPIDIYFKLNSHMIGLKKENSYDQTLPNLSILAESK